MTEIHGELVRRMIVSAANNLQNNRKKINDLNVFPVPDGDTGTNMGLTFGGAAAEAAACGEAAGAGELLETLARASLRNARGNSGVILSQILRGLATATKEKEALTAADIRAAACESRDTAYRAVMKPTEGTILTVVREMAEYAQADESETDPLALLLAMLDAGQESLARTPEILPALKQAGVVDAGGMGVIALLEGALLAAAGKPVAPNQETAVQAAAGQKRAAAAAAEPVDLKYQYCTEFLINKSANRQAAQFTAAIRPKGDCMLVIEEEELVKVHIHTNHPGFVIEQALKLGELTDLKIDNMRYQHEERIRQPEEPAPPPVPLKRYGFVAVSAGPGLDEVFRSVGVDALVEGGQTMNPSTQDLLDAVQSIAAETVFILPNNKNILLAAEQVKDLTQQEVVVIPTRNIPQGVSAMLAFDDQADTDANRAAMEEMAETVRCGQVTFAARDSVVDGQEIHKDDAMGLFHGEIQAVGPDKNQVALALTDAMAHEEAGVITVYYGADVEPETAKALETQLRDRYEYLDVSLLSGGQPVYYYLIAVE